MNFDEAFKHVIGVEGGYTNDVRDAGGPTKYGITIHALRKYLRRNDILANDVKNLDLGTAKKIYRQNYWNTWNLDQVKNKLVATVLFDQAVNWGTGSSTVKRIQRSLNNIGHWISVDGQFGPKTMAAVNLSDPVAFAFEFIASSQDDYIKLVKRKPKYMVFLSGWINRTQELLKKLIGGKNV